MGSKAARTVATRPTPITLAVTALAGLLLAGCGTARQGHVPFELYDSPVLASQTPDPGPTPRSMAGAELASRKGSPSTGPAGRPAPAPPERRGPPPKNWNGDPDQEPINAEEAKETTAAANDTAGDATNASRSSGASKAPAAIANAARYVAAIYEVNGITFDADQRTSIPAIYRKCRANHAVYSSETPAAGDMAFFHNTTDTNDDGRNNDWYTHIAIVETVDDDGVVTLLSYRDGEVQSFKMNPNQPDAKRTRHGRTANSVLRPKTPDDPPFTQHLAGQLFAGYCSLLGDKKELVVIDNWQPGMNVSQ